ncbi:MAG: ATP-binding protein [Bellilinea sp.]
MAWIVLGEENGKIKLVSKSASGHERPGILPKGSFLTIEINEADCKFILRVDDSSQFEPYKPSPLVIDMDLSGLYADAKCQNVIHAYRVKNISKRIDGKIDFIPPQSIARRSNQGEIDLAFGSVEKGPRIFLSTVHGGQNQLLVDENLLYITSILPEDMFFHQMQICGKTGSGKTVAMKYLAQYFVEKMNGAVLAINVKDVDFLKMDKPSTPVNDETSKEWKMLGEYPRGIENCVIYYPANTRIEAFRGINYEITQKITLDVNTIEPEALTGLLQHISEVGAQNFPDIFRYWQQKDKKKVKSFNQFVEYFQESQKEYVFTTMNVRGDISQVTLHSGTYDNISRNLNSALEFFDNKDAKSLDYDDILSSGKMSIINVAGSRGIQFGSILLRHLLKRIVEVKSQQISTVPILVIIDEVHQFYNTESSKEALGDLDTICRTGRSQKIGVIFASQNPNDLPKGLSSVINSKIFFRSDDTGTKSGISTEEIQTLMPGYAVVNIHNLPQLKTIKFPISLSGVIVD